jgi:hypothetical protein
MAAIFSAVCVCCGKRFEGSPSYAFNEPLHYHCLSPEEQQTRCERDENFCCIRHEAQTDYFIRVCLEIPINGLAEPFLWGVWASISEKNLKRYIETWDTPDETDSYFGWLCNEIPTYTETAKLKILSHPRRNNRRPWIEIEPGDHPLYHDWKNGISEEQVKTIMLKLMHRNES